MIDSLKGIKPGSLFTTDGEDVWVVESFCEHPTITLRNLRSGEKTGGAIGCLNVAKFVRLLPAGELGSGLEPGLADMMGFTVENPEVKDARGLKVAHPGWLDRLEGSKG